MRKLMPSWIRVLVVFFIIAALVEYFVDSGDMPAFINQPTVLIFLMLVLLILIAIEVIVESLNNVLYQTLDKEAKARYDAEKAKPSKIVAWIKANYKKLLVSKPIEEEHEII